jgi:hypothetical protein
MRWRVRFRGFRDARPRNFWFDRIWYALIFAPIPVAAAIGRSATPYLITWQLTVAVIMNLLVIERKPDNRIAD